MEESNCEYIQETARVNSSDLACLESPDMKNFDHDYLYGRSGDDIIIDEVHLEDATKLNDANEVTAKHVSTDTSTSTPLNDKIKVKSRGQHLNQFLLKSKNKNNGKRLVKSQKDNTFRGSVDNGDTYTVEGKKIMSPTILDIPSGKSFLINQMEPVKIVQIAPTSVREDSSVRMDLSHNVIKKNSDPSSKSKEDLQLQISNVFDAKKDTNVNVKQVLLNPRQSHLKVLRSQEDVIHVNLAVDSSDPIQDIPNISQPSNSSKKQARRRKRSLEIPAGSFSSDSSEQKKKLKVVKEILAWIPSDPGIVMDIRGGNKKPVMMLNGNTTPAPNSSSKVPLTSKTSVITHRKILPAPPQNPVSYCSNCNAKLNSKTIRKDLPVQNNNVTNGIINVSKTDLSEPQSEFPPSGITPGLRLLMNEMEAYHTNSVKLQRQIDKMKNKEKNYIDSYNTLLKEFESYKAVSYKMASKSIADTLKQSLSENQVDILMKSKTKPIWTTKEVNNAFKLYRISKAAFNFVRDELHLPLPCRGSILKFALNNKRKFKQNLLRAKRKLSVNGSLAINTTLESESSYSTEDVEVYTTKETKSTDGVSNSFVCTAAELLTTFSDAGTVTEITTEP